MSLFHFPLHRSTHTHPCHPSFSEWSTVHQPTNPLPLRELLIWQWRHIPRSGEIFKGIYININSGNDTEILLQALGKCCSSNSHLWTITDSCDEKGQRKITGVLSAIKGPWAVIYWQRKSYTWALVCNL
ncbi:hypothetical protein CIPAW_04G124200 [Carya illinoinensis]|uniref:Uncharacterized protein n=1 Tax=Carya illinoinensis TaxID=32201 RepID=A0A8T1QUP9_CARIL|nr:hypothetical protein CIPAW_04G124200 [Carya illinoinensis]